MDGYLYDGPDHVVGTKIAVVPVKVLESRPTFTFQDDRFVMDTW